MDPLQQDDTLKGTLNSSYSMASKKNYDPKRRKFLMDKLAEGVDPGAVRYAHVMQYGNEDEVNDAINTFQRIKNNQQPSADDVDINARNWAIAISNKLATPQQAKDSGVDINSIMKELSTMGAPKTDKEKETEETEKNKVPVFDDKIAQIDKLKDDWYLDAAVGPNPLVRNSMTNWMTGGKDDFIGKVQQIADQETLDKLIEIKGEGATLGALSDSEREMLQRAATPIWSWVKKNGDGKIVGYDIGEEDFKAELERLKQNVQRRKENIMKSGQTNKDNDPLGLGI